MEKLQFCFKVIPTTDGKSNVIGITSITTEDDRIFKIPEELQNANLHEQLIATNAFKKVKNSLKKRHQERNIWIKLTKEIKETYVDAEENLQFDDVYLENIKTENITAGHADVSTLNRLLKTLIENPRPNNLKHITEKFIIDRFTSKNPNPSRWMEIFEQECNRFDINEDSQKIEVLRFFMEGSCKDWFSSMFTKLTVHGTWDEWKKNFSETFATKGWNPVTYALHFKYREGLLIDYAIRKEKLLIDMRQTIDKGTLIDLIAAGLPEFILNRIDREMIRETSDLFNELNKYEHMVSKKSFNKKTGTNAEDKNKTPCTTCEKLNKGKRFHAETACWFNKKDDKGTKNIRHVNNSVIESELNESDQKNE